MKHTLLLTILLAACTGMASAQNKADKSKGRFYFKEGEAQDHPNLQPPKIAMDTFWFENIGNAPIVITYVTPSSKFISADWTHEAVRPEQRGFISYIVKTSQHSGPYKEDLFIQSNAVSTPGETTYRLYITGSVGSSATKTVKKKKPVKKTAPAATVPPAK
jgi:hypothetical protein